MHDDGSNARLQEESQESEREDWLTVLFIGKLRATRAIIWQCQTMEIKRRETKNPEKQYGGKYLSFQPTPRHST